MVINQNYDEELGNVDGLGEIEEGEILKEGKGQLEDILNNFVEDSLDGGNLPLS